MSTPNLFWMVADFVDALYTSRMRKKASPIKFEIIWNNRINHPVVVYAKNGHKYKFLGLTHSKKTNNKLNKQLVVNPNPLDKSVSYFQPYVQQEHKREFGKKLVGWKISKQDKLIMKRYMK